MIKWGSEQMKEKAPGYPVRKGDMAILRKTFTSTALNPENQQDPRDEYFLVRIGSATRNGWAKSVQMTEGGINEKLSLMDDMGSSPIVMALKGGSHDLTKHPALVKAFDAANWLGVGLGDSRAVAGDSIGQIIREWEDDNES